MSCEIQLRLSGHCVETAARNEFKRLMDLYFEGAEQSGDLECRLELLKEFLEQSDFPALRSSDSRLTGDADSTLTVFRGEYGAPLFRIEGQGRA